MKKYCSSHSRRARCGERSSGRRQPKLGAAAPSRPVSSEASPRVPCSGPRSRRPMRPRHTAMAMAAPRRPTGTTTGRPRWSPIARPEWSASTTTRKRRSIVRLLPPASTEVARTATAIATRATASATPGTAISGIATGRTATGAGRLQSMCGALGETWRPTPSMPTQQAGMKPAIAVRGFGVAPSTLDGNLAACPSRVASPASASRSTTPNPPSGGPSRCLSPPASSSCMR